MLIAINSSSIKSAFSMKSKKIVIRLYDFQIQSQLYFYKYNLILKLSLHRMAINFLCEWTNVISGLRSNQYNLMQNSSYLESE